MFQPSVIGGYRCRVSLFLHHSGISLLYTLPHPRMSVVVHITHKINSSRRHREYPVIAFYGQFQALIQVLPYIIHQRM